MMNTPICDFVKKYADSDAVRLHMPGHKGSSLLGVERLDITEIDGADVLYDSCGIIRESEENAAELFGTARTVYSAEGSSLSIRAMLYLVTLYAKSMGKRSIIAAGRNAHKVFISAAALLDFDIVWLSMRRGQAPVSCSITAEYLEGVFSQAKELPTAVYITSPDYIGHITDIASLSRVCRKYGVLLIVDNAHGAYLRFLPRGSWHPIDQGADMTADSAHKTLPVLTGGAYLHISKNAPRMFCDMCERAMAMFASTSPSYLILQSLDAANRYLSDGYSEKLGDTAKEVIMLRASFIRREHVYWAGEEPLKLTVVPKPFGYTGYDFANALRKFNVIAEFAAPDTCTLMFTPEIDTVKMSRVYRAFAEIPRLPGIRMLPPDMPIPERIMSVREAAMAVSETVEVSKAKGRVLADASVSCPPAIPIVMCGELINDDAIRAFEYYGVHSVRVVK